MEHIAEKSFLFLPNVTGPLMECPDVFELGGKAVVLGSFPGVAPRQMALPTYGR